MPYLLLLLDNLKDLRLETRRNQELKYKIKFFDVLHNFSFTESEKSKILTLH